MNYKLIAYAQDFTSFLMQNLAKDADRIRQIILFGSVTRGETGRKSDIDLFIDVIDESVETRVSEITEQFYRSIKVKKYWELLGVKNEIHCSVGRLEEWDELQRSLIANGIVLYGKYKGETETEQYYLFKVSPGKNRNRNVSVWRALYGYKQKVGRKVYIREGLVREYRGRKLARGVFVIPADHAQKMGSFLRKKKFKHEIIPFWQDIELIEKIQRSEKDIREGRHAKADTSKDEEEIDDSLRS